MKLFERYNLNINGRCVAASALWMGVYFFLYVVYYLGLEYAFAQAGGTLFANMILPLILSGLYVILLKGVRLNIPVVYQVLGFALCLLAILGHSGVQRIIGVIWLVLAVAVSVCTLLGVLKSKAYMVVLFLAMPVYQAAVLYQGFPAFSLQAVEENLLSFAQLAMFLSVVFLPGGMKLAERRKK